MAKRPARRVLSLPRDPTNAGALFHAFGVPVTLTHPDGTVVRTKGIWVDEEPFSFSREPRLPPKLSLAEDAARYLVERQKAVSGAAQDAGRDVIASVDAIRAEIVNGRIAEALDAAMMVGLAVARYRRAHQTQPGGRGKALSDVADRVELQQDVQRLSRRFQASDELKDQYRSLTAYVAHELKVSNRSARRYVRRYINPTA